MQLTRFKEDVKKMKLNEKGKMICEGCFEELDSNDIAMAIKRKNDDTLYFCSKCRKNRVEFW